MNNPQDDKIAELYQKTPKARPSEILDARIRQEARRQIKHGRTLHSYRWLSVAALLVLSVGVVLRIINEVPVEQPLEEHLEMMDAVPVLKEESRAIIDADIGFSVQEEKMKKAAKPALNTAPESRMKVQKMPAPSAQSLSERAFEPEVSSGMSAEKMPLKKKAYSPENFCGIESLRQVEDPEQWKVIVQQLTLEKRLDQAECLERLMQEHFDTRLK